MLRYNKFTNDACQEVFELFSARHTPC